MLPLHFGHTNSVYAKVGCQLILAIPRVTVHELVSQVRKHLRHSQHGKLVDLAQVPSQHSDPRQQCGHHPSSQKLVLHHFYLPILKLVPFRRYLRRNLLVLLRVLRRRLLTDGSMTRIQRVGGPLLPGVLTSTRGVVLVHLYQRRHAPVRREEFWRINTCFKTRRDLKSRRHSASYPSPPWHLILESEL